MIGKELILQQRQLLVKLPAEERVGRARYYVRDACRQPRKLCVVSPRHRGKTNSTRLVEFIGGSGYM